MQRNPSTLGDLLFNPLSLPLFQRGNMLRLLLFLLPSFMFRLFSFLLLLLCLLKCFFILLVSSTSPFFPLNSLIFSFPLFDVLPHFSLTLYSLLSFFLSLFFPPLLFSYLLLLLEFASLTLQNYLLSPYVKLLPSYNTVWHLSLIQAHKTPILLLFVKECDIHISATLGKKMLKTLSGCLDLSQIGKC